MDGILIIDKDKDMTSRDVVDELIKKFNTKKIGHTGTLDPIATGVLVVCVGRATKLVSRLTSTSKEYIADVELGTLTDTLDITGKIKEDKPFSIDQKAIEIALNQAVGTYEQEVPIYSAVKVNGKKLYQYAREKEEVELPKKEVTIYSTELLEYKNDGIKTRFKFKCLVSKGTYIRSLIRDIAHKLNTEGTMLELRRIKQGDFLIKDSIKLEDANEAHLIPIKKVLDCKQIELTPDIEKKVLNGTEISDTEEILFLKDDVEVALYKYGKCQIMFKGGKL